MKDRIELSLLLFMCLNWVVFSETDPNDFAILDEFRKGLENPELLNWPSNGEDPCGPPLWDHVFCSGPRVGQIQVQGLGLRGPLPKDFNKLSELTNIGLQKNEFNGKLPSFNGLAKLQYAYLNDNQFDTIPSDFFVGLDSLQVLALDDNPLNKSNGWLIPPELENSGQLMNLSLIQCNLVGRIPDFLGRMASLTNLKLSYNKLSGGIPSSFYGSSLQTLWLNNQNGPVLNGTIDAIASMTMLTDLMLHGNSFTGTIPNSISDCVSMKRLCLNNNLLVGLVPANLTSLPQLEVLTLDNNKFMGPMPKSIKPNFTFTSNSFCEDVPGKPCLPEVSALLDFLSGVNYPMNLINSWVGDNPCNSWRGIVCSNGLVNVLAFQNLMLSGTISPSLGKLDKLESVRLDRNNLTGTIPTELTNLKSLSVLNLSNNNLAPPIPSFANGVTIVTFGNPLLDLPGHPNSPPGISPSSGDPSSPTGGNPSPRGTTPSSPNGDKNPSKPTHFNPLIVVIPIAIVVLIIALVVLFVCLRRNGKKGNFASPSSIIVHPRDPSDPNDMVKISVANNHQNSMASNGIGSSYTGNLSDGHMIETGNLVISVQILRSLTQGFAPSNELGRGGFGVVYKGELHDGTMIAVKRMESSVVTNKALDEFQAEIAVLSKVRHRHLVSLLGYSIEGHERLLVYEYMPQGALSKHLFRWKVFGLEPLSWKRRLNIALDVGRAMEYLHNLAHQTFIHRDLKSSNILLDDAFRAKVSDFGLVKLAPDGKDSVATRLAGTFGYLAPEYAVTGKVTTKADVFSFGVVLMELVTGRPALDEDQPEESRYLASWFCSLKSNKEKLKAAIDPSLIMVDEIFDSISIIADLAGHCANRDPHQRPDMGHAVNVLAPLVEKWKPMSQDHEEYMGIDLRQPLIQMVKGWQDADGSTGMSSMSLDDSKGSIPTRPIGFADSFTSADGR